MGKLTAAQKRGLIAAAFFLAPALGGTECRDKILNPSDQTRSVQCYDPHTHELLSEETYRADQKNGESKFYDRGTLTRLETYSHDELEGWYKLYWPNGRLHELKNYHADLLEGVTQIYRDDGTLVEERDYQKGLQEGPAKSYFAGQQVHLEEYYLKGHHQGEQKEYWQNGKLKLIQHYANGELEGLLQEYREGGSPYREEHYVKGRLDGLQTIFYANGKPDVITTYKNGQRHGLQRSFRENGDERGASCYQFDTIVTQLEPCGRTTPPPKAKTAEPATPPAASKTPDIKQNPAFMEPLVIDKKKGFLNSDVESAMKRLIKLSKNVSLAFLVDSLTCPALAAQNQSAGGAMTEGIHQWEESVRRSLVSDAEQRTLDRFAGDPDFKILDRSQTAKVFEELKFQLTGAVSPETAKQIGKLAGATHLCVISFHRDISTDSAKVTLADWVTYRIIDVETGRVVASQVLSQTQKIRQKS